MTLSPRFDDGRVSLYEGRAEAILPQLPRDSVDAIITDPPYSSGGMTRSDRAADPHSKYISTGTARRHVSFSGDNRDGRSWAFWCTLWLAECLEIVKESGYILMFTDWRMLPTASDVLQAAGFVWRGVIAWDKTEASRPPHTGYFRHQCEYLVWGTKGVSLPCDHGGPWPGCFRFPVRQDDKYHMTGKPTGLMRQLVQVAPENGLILDPFAGSGTTLVASQLENRRALGCELSPEYCQIAIDRIRQRVLV